MLELRLRPEAELDLQDAAFWYGEQLAGLGHKFLDEAMEVFSAIAETPLLYAIVHRNTRRALMHRFPFCVFYQVDSASIMVVAIMHSSRNPQSWKSRD